MFYILTFYTKNILFSLFVFLTASLSVFAQSVPAEEQVPVFSLDNQWSIYDKQAKAYIPFLPSLHFDKKQLYLVLDTKKYQDFYLSIFVEENSYFFVNNNLFAHFTTASWQHFKIDSLQKLSRANPLLITYFSKKIFKKLPSASITLKRKNSIANADTMTIADEKTSNHTIINIKSENKVSKNFLMLTILGVLSIVAFFSQVNQPIFSLHFLSSTLKDFIKGKSQIRRLSAPNFMLFLLFYGFSLSYIIIFFATYTDKVDDNIFLNEGNNDLWGRLEYWGILSIFVIAIVCVKFLIIWFLGILYSDRQIVSLHMQEYMNISQVFCVIMLCITLLFNSIQYDFLVENLNWLVYIFVFLLFLQSVLLTYRINNATNYKKVYLFSYLCASEYFPLILSAKFFSS
jgi:hypothetical protein